ncbi:nucleocapsid protein [RtMc arterivirus]|uniref:Nucleoprotein n=1 Tax=RtMc arterivirus TaxID=2847274 RepID=A0A2H4MZS4_9NIDO|nr:nucleocapsid protein [Rodent arterivirus]ATP66635.1 nucleocapsid protein [RtMc arterivirus]
MPGNKNKKGKQPKKGNGQPVNQLCQMLGKMLKTQQRQAGRGGQKNRKGRSSEKPHFPLAGEDDVRHHFNQVETRLCLASIQTAFNQGAGVCTMSDSGRIAYQVEFSLPTSHTVRLIRVTAPTP